MSESILEVLDEIERLRARNAELEQQLAELREALKETEAFLTAAIKACKCL